MKFPIKRDARKYLWLGLGDVNNIAVENPILIRDDEQLANPGLLELELMGRPEYLHWAAKVFLDIDLLPFQMVILRELWKRPFSMLIVSRGGSKSFCLAVLCLLKMVLTSDCKIVVTGAGLRQARIVFDYIVSIWSKSSILQSIARITDGPKYNQDRMIFNLVGNTCIAIPLGTGEKIRGIRATLLLNDEFAATPPDIYETVVSGFAAVSSSPMENVQITAMRKYALEQGVWTADEENTYINRKSNQSILAGTAEYSFNHFYHYWQKYRAIIKSRGDEKKLREIFPEGNLPNWKDYSIIRIPYNLIPDGFMDEKTVTRAKALVKSNIYNKEYGAVFPTDSDGFFKRSMLEKCTVSETNNIELPSGKVLFDAITRGNKGSMYVMGVDPAAEIDNFSIVVLEVHPDHARIVYVWTTNKSDYKEKLKKGITAETDYFGFCSRKIRDLINIFPVDKIVGPSVAIDAQGGGNHLLEALQDKNKMKEGEIAIYEALDTEKEKETDDMPGKHYVKMIQFANAKWTSESNHGMKKDFNDKVLLFPRYDPVTLGLAAFTDGEKSIYDSLEDCIFEIEQLKSELSEIVYTHTGSGVSGRERWDTPETRSESGKRGRLRKDRYSALLMANWLAHLYRYRQVEPVRDFIGGNIDMLAMDKNKNNSNKLSGPDWWQQGGTLKGFGVFKRKP